ncbi:MAG: dioxygenase [Pseudomonadota bacterium]
MRNVTKDNITEVFKSYMAQGTDPRFREIMESLVTHLHAFARETNLSHEEWQAGLEFMEKSGMMCTEDRHEFVLLSDVLGLSSLVDMLHNKPGGTSSSVLGPFHVMGAPDLAIGGDLRGDFDAPVLISQGVIKAPDGTPIEGAKLDIWQTAPNGLYASQDDKQDVYSFHGIQTTGADGRYAFTSVKPVEYEVPTDGPIGDFFEASGRHAWRPSHLHFIVKAEGYRPLVTEVFPDDDPYLDQDTVFGVRKDLIMSYQQMAAGTFPDGFELSGTVDDAYLKVEFDLTLVPA